MARVIPGVVRRDREKQPDDHHDGHGDSREKGEELEKDAVVGFVGTCAVRAHCSSGRLVFSDKRRKKWLRANLEFPRSLIRVFYESSRVKGVHTRSMDGEQQRTAILDAIREIADGLDTTRVAALVELHPNTVRWHLSRLEGAGLL